jgi:AhpD family alkylhydroperoxidase
VIVRTSQLNRCDYCLASHSRIARKLGWNDEQLEHLDEYALRDDFTLQERTGLRLAELMTRNERPLSDPEWQEMREAFSEGEVVELMAAIGLFNYFNRFNNLLGMEPTAPGVQ